MFGLFKKKGQPKPEGSDSDVDRAFKKFAASSILVKCYACGHKWETPFTNERGVIRSPMDYAPCPECGSSRVARSGLG
jgi:DNA-directed RNA polymerase subunit RPC12/RpoP